MIVHRQVAFGMLAIGFLAMAVYCYAGYIMTGSVIVSNPERDYGRDVAWWTGGIALGLLGALASGIAAWRADPGQRR